MIGGTGAPCECGECKHGVNGANGVTALKTKHFPPAP
jgi:hypothetical protein